MFKPLQKQRRNLFVLLFVIILNSCMQVRLDAPPALPTTQDIEKISNEMPDTTTPQTKSPTPTGTEILPTPTSTPQVTLKAINGNVFIRRGPHMAYNPIDVLYKDTSVQAIARDVLSKWVQIIIPKSNKTGWISVQTEYTQLTGDLNSLPEITPTDWPIPAYLRNCTHHQMYIMPSEIVLPSTYGQPENEIWVYPGFYTAYDLDVPGEPEVFQADIREGMTAEILDDGLGEHRKCP